MTLFQALILGIIQGLTEFIPVSSTAHLLIGQRLLGIESSDFIFAFIIIIQLGTVLSLIVVFWRDLWRITKEFFKNPFTESADSLNRLAWYIILATIPAALIGYLVRNEVKTLFNEPLLGSAIRLFSAAALMFLAERLGSRIRQLDSMHWLDALMIGFFQGLAIFPGASRSGSTISGGMLRGFNRTASARFAFLMSIPIMLGAVIYQIIDVVHLPGFREFVPVLALGFTSAAIVGWLAVRWLLSYLNKNSLNAFAAYCTLAGLAVLLFNIFV
ncbi:MAG: undecaprenyl-diphosphatase UppP [Anaerolineales bacterium]|uniref:Undecaprenyl-diphosphatase n=1 Tax=Candidatus Desulfolinea nitratireducens TaxID=2841698 RepID=A0A8J6NFS6_9CHLR|nr:undecaprenyl-diphosphatase UppP [Candidatus Desulfolinea nitratireducens]MBL6961249.1 undecaprenyl-diphosphatase UppP [Anaerolineales bacterium]